MSLRVIENVGLAGSSLGELAEKSQLDLSKTELLVKAAVALDLLQRDGDLVLLGAHGAALLGQPWIMKFVEHHRHFYQDLADPVALLRGASGENHLKKYWSYDDEHSSKDDYSLLMAESQKAVSQQILLAYDFRPHRRMLDVGGGVGAFLRAVGERHAALELNLFDLPGVVALAKEHAGLSRIHLHSGSFHNDELPPGMDVISLVRVLHDHDDGPVLELLRKVRRAISPGGVLLVAEPLAGDASTAAVTDAYFNLYFAAMGQGRTRSPREIESLALQAGFGRLQRWPTDMPLITSVVSFSTPP